MSVDKSACPKECIPINNKLKMTPNGIKPFNNMNIKLYPQSNQTISMEPNILSSTIINQPIVPSGFNKISVNHGMPNSTLVQ